MIMYGNFEYFPNTGLGFNVVPNYDIIKNRTIVDNEQNNFAMAREQVNGVSDLSIVKGNPV